MERKHEYTEGPCPSCGAPRRRKYVLGRNKNSRAQHPRWRVCQRGHQSEVKRG